MLVHQRQRRLAAGALGGQLRALHLEAIVRIGLAALDLPVRQLARVHGIAAGILRAGEVVGHGLDLEDVQAAELGDLAEAERSVVDQPRGGRVRHQGSGLLGHGLSPEKITRAAPRGAAVTRAM